MKNLSIVLAMLLAVFFVAACGGSSESSDAETPAADAAAKAGSDDEAALIKASCVSCHGMEKVTGYKGDESWKEVVDEMVNDKGAKIAAADIPKIVAYLDKTYPKK